MEADLSECYLAMVTENQCSQGASSNGDLTSSELDWQVSGKDGLTGFPGGEKNKKESLWSFKVIETIVGAQARQIAPRSLFLLGHLPLSDINVKAL